ncbi:MULTISPECIES: SDR family NAD(P)-dependent oxidoreductase [Haloferax]|uniref:SDR family NAD(P)-dependent oxidoreductase n=1 Tax=Haloferax marinum TaxID=2666143 RepID=A0A6A8G390_9EURY|nr:MULTISPECIES: SDR family NAD(P)-dependent oxidoreductase [Haloferax]KAB1196597.1 SDR family NAD(P)-dependent oxidoreductase [Haloferax sp. CBA1150]MRW95601.1 SDR family NAD(P)-dependent oxidoreductase [Haloferax marinum]
MSNTPEAGAGVEWVDLSDRTALVTGSTSGIGRETALALGRLGATVFVHGRDRDAGRQVASAIDDAGGDAIFFRADLSEVETVHRLAAEIRARTDRLDILVNNAAANFSEGRLTDDGVERTFAINHLAPFVLTLDLRDLLPDDGRVVTVSSGVHPRADGSFDVTTVDDYDGLDAYARSKLANILFTVELARRFDGPTANCCHPGLVPASQLWRDASIPIRLAVGLLERLPEPLTRRVIDTPATGAETSVYLAASPDVEGVTGQYFSDCAPKEPAPIATDDRLASELWKMSEDLTGVTWS